MGLRSRTKAYRTGVRKVKKYTLTGRDTPAEPLRYRGDARELAPAEAVSDAR